MGTTPQQQAGPYPSIASEGYSYPPQNQQPTAGAPSGLGPYPYQSHPVGAPGGYPAAPAGAPPGVSADAVPHTGKQYDAGHVGVTPPSGYPGAYAAPPVTVNGYQAGPAVMDVAAADQQPRCACSMGWVLFAIGFIFPICWIVAAFLPLCTRNRYDRLAAMCSSICFIVYTAVILGVALTQSNRGQYYYYG